MSQKHPDKTFPFNSHFNSQYINELYEGDMVMIEETFADVLKEYDAFLQNINICHQAEDVAGLKSAIHKIKPLCGYVGLTVLQSECQQFENACLTGEFAALRNEGVDLFNKLLNAKAIIAEEKIRLEAFNNGEG
jgi:HPt (histidine-containing phosphotransfer) domain-containing protein